MGPEPITDERNLGLVIFGLFALFPLASHAVCARAVRAPPSRPRAGKRDEISPLGAETGAEAQSLSDAADAAEAGASPETRAPKAARCDEGYKGLMGPARLIFDWWGSALGPGPQNAMIMTTYALLALSENVKNALAARRRQFETRRRQQSPAQDGWRSQRPGRRRRRAVRRARLSHVAHRSLVLPTSHARG